MNDEVKGPATVKATKVKRTRATRAIARPPDTAAGDIDQLFDRIRTIAAPTALTGPWAQGFGLAPDTATVLKWLGVAKDGQVDESLWNAVRVPATRQAALDRLVREAYSPIFEQVDVSEASRDVISGAFITKYKMGDPIRYVRAFVTLCRHAGIRVGADDAETEPKAAITGKARSTATRAAVVPKTSEAAPGPKPDPIRRSDPSQGGSPAAGPTIAVNVEIPANWTEDQIKERLATVRRALGEPDQ